MISQQEADQLFADAERAQEAAAFMADVPQQESEVKQWLRSYNGTFAFLIDMKGRLLLNKSFTDAQIAAIKRCWLREQERLADQADRLLDEYYAADVKPLPRFEPVTEAGFYIQGETIFKVQKAVHGSGKLYAKQLMIAGDKGSFEYAPGMINKLRAGDKLTKERAAELGQLYGMCMICGATLTDEQSIERGIGPICAGKL